MTSVVKDKNSCVGQQNAQLLRFRKSNTPRGPSLERSWQENTKSGLGWEEQRLCRRETDRNSQRGWRGKKRKHRGKTQTKDRRAQEAGLPRDRKLQVSQKEARKHRMWAAGESRAKS